MITKRVEEMRGMLSALTLVGLSDVAAAIGCSRKTMERFRSGLPMYQPLLERLDAFLPVGNGIQPPDLSKPKKSA